MLRAANPGSVMQASINRRGVSSMCVTVNTSTVREVLGAAARLAAVVQTMHTTWRDSSGTRHIWHKGQQRRRQQDSLQLWEAAQRVDHHNPEGVVPAVSSRRSSRCRCHVSDWCSSHAVTR
jgi:hypothetical protein